DAVEWCVRTHEYAQSPLHLLGCPVEQFDRLDAGAYVVALKLRGEREQHRGAGLEQLAVLLQSLGEDHRLVLARRIRQTDDSHSVSRGPGSPLAARHDGSGDAPGARPRLHGALEFGP